MKKKSSVRMSSDGFSFHTFELRCYPGNKAFSAIHNAVKSKSKSKKCDYYPLKEHPNTYYSSVLQDHGIRIYLTAAEKRNVVKLIVNPRKLLDSKAGYIGIFQISSDAFDELNDQFTSVMRSVSLPESMDEWELHRLDLCVNLVSEHKKLPMRLISMMSRDRTPAGFEKNHYLEELRVNGNTKRDALAHRLTLSNESVAFVAYDKIYEIKNHAESGYKKLKKKDKDNGILRIEVQLMSRWLSKYRQKHGKMSTSELLEDLARSSKKYICKYAKRLFCNGFYMHSGDLKNVIRFSSFIRKKTGKKMIKLVEKIDEGWSFATALDDVKRKWTPKQRLVVLDAFDRLGISPIPLHYKKVRRLPSISEILNSLDDESDEIVFE